MKKAIIGIMAATLATGAMADGIYGAVQVGQTSLEKATVLNGVDRSESQMTVRLGKQVNDKLAIEGSVAKLGTYDNGTTGDAYGIQGVYRMAVGHGALGFKAGAERIDIGGGASNNGVNPVVGLTYETAMPGVKGLTVRADLDRHMDAVYVGGSEVDATSFTVGVGFKF